MKMLGTGGGGFMGAAGIRHLSRDGEAAVVNLDKLTYAATPEALEEAADSSRYAFAKVDVCDAQALRRAFAEHRPDAVMHLAAESHVDRSIDDAADFVRTNVVGRSEEHTSELQSLMRISYAVFCLKKKNMYYNNANIA